MSKGRFLRLSQAAIVDLFDESHGIFAELTGPTILLKAIQYQDNVGKLDDPNAAVAVTALHSLLPLRKPSQEDEDIVVEFENSAGEYDAEIYLMNEHGNVSQQWKLPAGETMVQMSKPGQVFVISVIPKNTVGHGNECLLGAYRCMKALPSGSPHYIFWENQKHAGGEGTDSFFLEFMLTNDSGIDALTVAAASLDPVMASSDDTDGQRKRLSILSTIVNNILHNPDDKKYQVLKFSNKSVHRYIELCSASMYFLHVLGFRETTCETDFSAATDHTASEAVHENPQNQNHRCLALSSKPRLDLYLKASETLQILRDRSEPHFVAEMAQPVPWEPPVWSAGAASRRWNTTGTHFITPEERWERTERWSALNRRNFRR